MALAPYPTAPPTAVVVWLDHWHAFVARRAEGRCAIVAVEREDDPELAYLGRVADVAGDCPRVMILGPDDDRLAFDHDYELRFARRDRFVEIEASPWSSSGELLDRLRLLET
jgi:hypothetical protein